MKHLKLFLLIMSMSLAVQYCDSGSSSARGAGGPDVTPDTVVEDTSTLPAAESSDVYTSVKNGSSESNAAVTVDEDAIDEAQEQPGEDNSEKLGEVVAKEEGDITADETTQQTSAEPTVPAEQAKETAIEVAKDKASEIAEQVAKEVAQEVAKEVSKSEIEEVSKEIANQVSNEIANQVAEQLTSIVEVTATENKEEAKEEAVKEIAEEVAKEIEKEIAEVVNTEVNKEESKEETPSTTEQPKQDQTAQEIAKEVSQDIAKTVAEEVAKDVASEISKDVTVEDEEEIEETDKDEEEIVAGMSIALDTTAGRWYKLEEKDSGCEKTGSYEKNKESIKKNRDKIKPLQSQLEEALKDYKTAEKEFQDAQKEYETALKASSGKGKGNTPDKGKLESKEKIKNSTKAKIDSINAQINDMLASIEKSRAEIGYGCKQKGIYTYWANENLKLIVKNVTEPGWYTLRIVAKNYGILPEWYKQFNVTVINETEDVEVGGISIPASDTKYFRGALDVYLDKGDTDLNLLWTNDAYEDPKDANIQIKRITLKWAKKSNKSMKRLVRNAHEYTSLDGRFFWDSNSAWTYWADQTMGFSFPNLEAGKYEITIMGKNYGQLPLPADYEYYTIEVEADGTSAQAQVPAAIKGWRKGSVVLDITGGTDIKLTWLNDSYKENEYDANFQFKKLILKRIGDSDRSALAAYLLGTKSGNRVLMTGALLILVGLITAISVWNRSRARTQE